MQFTGRNLQLVHEGLCDLLADVQNMIVTCPDPDHPEYAAALARYKLKRSEVRALLARIDEALKKET
jgi:hypothetical protein